MEPFQPKKEKGLVIRWKDLGPGRRGGKDYDGIISAQERDVVKITMELSQL